MLGGENITHIKQQNKHMNNKKRKKEGRRRRREEGREEEREGGSEVELGDKKESTLANESFGLISFTLCSSLSL